MQRDPHSEVADGGRPGLPQRASHRIGLSSRRAALVAWTSVAVYLIGFGLILWMDAHIYAAHTPVGVGGLFWLGLHGPWLGPFVVFAVVGGIVASRRPRHTIGWIMLASALCVVVGEAFRTYVKLVLGGESGAPVSLALAYQPFEAITILGVLLGVVFVPLFFPDGRLPSRGWRAIVWVSGLFVALNAVRALVTRRLTDTIFLPDGDPIVVYDVANPFAIAGLEDTVAPTVSDLLLAALVAAAVVAVVVRFRRSHGIQRQQMKWFVYAAALVGLAIVGLVVLEMLSAAFPLGLISMGLLAAGLTAYPVAIGIAVLRYRLYEIDRIVSRTVTYGVVVAVLAGVYVLGVLGLGAAVTAASGSENSDLVVAVSTLAVAGLFRPVRARVRTAVDRRFNRTGYEARMTVEAFTEQVRDEVALDQIRRRVAETAAVTVQPTHVSIWLLDVADRR